ncbi:cation:proton antiporter [Streptomyces sp. NPDC059819]|uniref:cation:proton antiporter n=1 Tax=Streptomyces sp. NPDC059819 TaxID=3346963 RepID=UPI003660D66C
MASLSRTRPGQLSLFAAAVGDGGSWLALSVILSLASGGNPTSVIGKLIAVIALVALFMGPLRRLLAKLPDRSTGKASTTTTLTVALVVAVGATATLTAALGIHQLIGALLVGLVWPPGNRLANAAVAPLASAAKTVLLPFFFLGFGLSVNLGSLHLDGKAGVVLLSLLVVATAGKVIGPSLCARFTGLPWSEALTLGVLLNSRGLTELVVLQIGYEANIISAEMLGLLTIVALATTVMTTPLLKATGALRTPPPPSPAEPVTGHTSETAALALSGTDSLSAQPAGRPPE